MRLWQHLLKQQAAPAGAAYRYWRIYIQTTNGGSTYASLGEIQLRATAGGADITTAFTPVAESTYVLGYPGVKTVDDDVSSTYWISAAGSTVNQWLRYDLGSASQVVQVAMYPQIGGGEARAPKDFIIQGSNDGTSFADVKAFINVTGWTAAWKAFDL